MTDYIHLPVHYGHADATCRHGGVASFPTRRQGATSKKIDTRAFPRLRAPGVRVPADKDGHIFRPLPRALSAQDETLPPSVQPFLLFPFALLLFFHPSSISPWRGVSPVVVADVDDAVARDRSPRLL